MPPTVTSTSLLVMTTRILDTRAELEIREADLWNASYGFKQQDETVGYSCFNRLFTCVEAL